MCEGASPNWSLYILKCHSDTTAKPPTPPPLNVMNEYSNVPYYLVLPSFSCLASSAQPTCHPPNPRLSVNMTLSVQISVWRWPLVESHYYIYNCGKCSPKWCHHYRIVIDHVCLIKYTRCCCQMKMASYFSFLKQRLFTFKLIHLYFRRSYQSNFSIIQ